VLCAGVAEGVVAVAGVLDVVEVDGVVAGFAVVAVVVAGLVAVGAFFSAACRAASRFACSVNLVDTHPAAVTSTAQQKTPSSSRFMISRPSLRS